MQQPSPTHSPLPWTWERRDIFHDADVVRSDGVYVARCGVYANGCHNPGDAEFIVRAANSHYGLIASCDPDTLEAIADEIQCFEHSARAESLRILARQQRAAIAKAEAK